MKLIFVTVRIILSGFFCLFLSCVMNLVNKYYLEKTYNASNGYLARIVLYQSFYSKCKGIYIYCAIHTLVFVINNSELVKKNPNKIFDLKGKTTVGKSCEKQLI